MIYSPLEHLAKTVWLDKWKEGWFTMFSSALDASGTRSDSVLLVAGFISSTEQWIEFSKEWCARLEEDRLPFFRMSLFLSRNKPFDSELWKDRERRRTLLGDLVGIIQKHAFRKIGTAVLRDIHTSHLSKKNVERFRLSAYALAGAGANSSAQKWARSEKIASYVEPVFEDGDLGKGDLERQVMRLGYPRPIFRPKTDCVAKDGTIIKGYAPLQAADMLAHLFFRFVKRGIAEQNIPVMPFPFKEFDNMPGTFEYYSEENMTDFNKGLNEITDDLIQALDRSSVRRQRWMKKKSKNS